MSQINLHQIQEAALKLKGIVHRTPLIQAPELSHLIEGDVFLKLENLQITGSFKPRGAFIKMISLTPAEQARGIITMSAGNHAQGVAYHAKAMGIDAVIVMPEFTPVTKVEATQKQGARVILKGFSLSESSDYAHELAIQEGRVFVHPYDDPHIIAGQGTVALEMLEDCPDLDCLVIPIGGGGLAAGMSLAFKSRYPDRPIYGVQTAYCPAMVEALYPERALQREKIDCSLAEGIAVKSPGALTQTILRETLTDILIVSEQQIEAAICHVLFHNKLIAEGAGAAGVAALMAYPNIFKGKKVGTILCGGNLDARIISALVMRGLVGEGKLVRLKINIPDVPGLIAQLTKIIGDQRGNIFEISHQRLFNEINLKMTEVDITVETHNHDHVLEIVRGLRGKGFDVVLL